jgi:hypothetical protein
MQFRLLIDVDVIDFLHSLTSSRRRRLLSHFRKIQSFPGRHSDYIDQDEVGRRLDVSLLDGLAIFYWTDAADRHVKILKVTMAD